MTLKEKYEQEKAWVRQDAEQIRTATTYTEHYLKHGSGCDSSDRAAIRIGFVKQAEKIMLKRYKKEILDLAAELCLDSIGE